MFRLLLASSFAFVGTASAFAQSNPHHTSAELTAAWQEVKSRVFSTTLTWKLESSRGTKDEPFELRDVWEGRYLKFGGNGLLDLRQVRGV